MHDQHQAFFDDLATEWDLMFTAEDLERLSHIVDKIDVSEGSDILDLGCGTGILFDLLRRKTGPSGSVSGVDFSIEMARTAHRNFPLPNVNVVDADVIALPFQESSFDMAVAFAAFPHFSDKQRATDELHRVLRPKTKFHIIHLTSSKEISEMHQRIGGAVEHDEIPPEDQLREMLDISRFVDISIEDHTGLYLASATNTK